MHQSVEGSGAPGGDDLEVKGPEDQQVGDPVVVHVEEDDVALKRRITLKRNQNPQTRQAMPRYWNNEENITKRRRRTFLKQRMTVSRSS